MESEELNVKFVVVSNLYCRRARRHSVALEK